MDIIREEEIRKRQKYLDAEDRRNNPLKYALLELEQKKDEIVATLVRSARKNFTEGATRLHASADIKQQSSHFLVGCRQAQDLITTWLKEVDSRIQLTSVNIGPDCSGNIPYAAEITVEFTVGT